MTDTPRVLVVDDEPNIRVTLARALEDMAQVDTAMNGEEALARIEAGEYQVALLDLKMPGMGGMEVLRRMAEARPEIRFVIITAHGTVVSVVEAMKLGAADYLQKPFSPAEIRGLVRRILDRETLGQEAEAAYGSCLELAKRHIGDRRFDAALATLRKAAGLAPDRPEAFHLLGVLHEARGEKDAAMTHYRTAYWTDQSYAPARESLERAQSDGLSYPGTGGRGKP